MLAHSIAIASFDSDRRSPAPKVTKKKAFGGEESWGRGAVMKLGRHPHEHDSPSTRCAGDPEHLAQAQ